MQVKDLKKMLNELPENISQADFDNLDVMFSNDGNFFRPTIENSGFAEFGGTCDKDGNEIEDDGTVYPFFILVTENVFEES